MLNKYFKRSFLFERENLGQILQNIGWLSGDKILRMGVGLFIGVWVARYLGPEQFGLLNYATALTVIFGVFSTLGLDSILVRDLLKEPELEAELMGSTFFLKVIGAFTGILMAAISLVFLNPDEKATYWLVIILVLCFLFQAFDIIDYFFQSQVKSKYTVYARNLAFIIIALCRVTFILLKLPLIYFGLAVLLEAILSSIFLLIIYKRRNYGIGAWKVNFKLCKRMLIDGWPLILSSLMTMIYMRVDQIMIGNILNNTEVGIFSSAVRIVEIWYFIPMIIASSVFPALLKAKAKSEVLYLKRLKQLYTVMIWLAIIIAIVVTFFADFIILLLYDKAYLKASTVLVIYIWSGVGTFLGVASSQFLMIENLNKISFYRTMIGMVTNVVFNFLLIPAYGIIGAATATLISYFISTLGIIFFRKSRGQVLLMLKAFNPFSFK